MSLLKAKIFPVRPFRSYFRLLLYVCAAIFVIECTRLISTMRRHNDVAMTSHQRKVLVLAYYRSGSTLTGQLFNYNPSALYWFEPLAAVTEQWGWFNNVIPPRNLYHYDNGTEKLRTGKMTSTLVNPLQSIFSCNFTSLDHYIFEHNFMARMLSWNFSYSLQPFKTCTKPKNILRSCLPDLTDQCQRSDIVAVKVIRLHMTYVDQLLKDDPDLRLIHLVRDPRGMIESWKPLTRQITDGEAKLNARLMCQRIMTDCQIRRQLDFKYPNRTLLVRYEDLVTNTDRVLGDVYSRLLQLALPSNVTISLKENLRASENNGPYGTRRRNAMLTAFSWKQKIGSTVLNYVNKVCYRLLNELQYAI